MWGQPPSAVRRASPGSFLRRIEWTFNSDLELGNWMVESMTAK